VVPEVWVKKWIAPRRCKPGLHIFYVPFFLYLSSFHLVRHRMNYCNKSAGTEMELSNLLPTIIRTINHFFHFKIRYLSLRSRGRDVHQTQSWASPKKFGNRCHLITMPYCFMHYDFDRALKTITKHKC